MGASGSGAPIWAKFDAAARPTLVTSNWLTSRPADCHSRPRQAKQISAQPSGTAAELGHLGHSPGPKIANRQARPVEGEGPLGCPLEGRGAAGKPDSALHLSSWRRRHSRRSKTVGRRHVVVVDDVVLCPLGWLLMFFLANFAARKWAEVGEW